MIIMIIYDDTCQDLEYIRQQVKSVLEVVVLKTNKDGQTTGSVHRQNDRYFGVFLLIYR